MSRRDHQPDSKILERIALFGVVLFGLGITYAIHVTNKTIAKMDTHVQAVQNEIHKDLATTSNLSESD